MSRRKAKSRFVTPSRKRWHVPPGQRDAWPIEPPPREKKHKQAQEQADAGNAKSRR